MDTPSHLPSSESPQERAGAAPRGLLLALALCDFLWAAAAGLVSFVLLPVTAIVVALQVGAGACAGWIAEGWRNLSGAEQASVVAITLLFLAASVLDVFLLVGALRLLCGRPGGSRCIRTWALGAFALTAVDLAWVLAGWAGPWSWLAVAVVLVTPAWAAANLTLLRAPSVRAQLAPAARAGSA